MRSPKHLDAPAIPQASRNGAVSVLGTGSIGNRHLRVLRDLVGADLSAIPVRAIRRSELRTSGIEVRSNLKEAVAAGARAVIVATDTSRHVTDLRTALELGCSVLVEKPLAASTSGLSEIARLIARGPNRVYIACNLRFDLSLLQFRKRLHEIGTVHAVRIECQSYLPDWRPNRDYLQSYSARAGEGGVLLDLIHEIDYAVWLFGAPTRVFARLQNSGRLGIASEEAADLYWETPDAAAISIRLDYLSRSAHRTMLAFGAFGEIAWDGVAQTVTLRLKDQPPQTAHFPQQRDATMQDQDAAFLLAARGGDPGTLTTFEDAAVAVSICDAARLSSAGGKFEAVMDWRKA
ncbi:MAG TPA: Gfo/Idh/MocA family oxidoreductase [Terriglobales bacterium]